MRNASLLIAALLLGLLVATQSKASQNEQQWSDLEEMEGEDWDMPPDHLIDNAERQIEDLVKLIKAQEQKPKQPIHPMPRHPPKKPKVNRKGKGRASTRKRVQVARKIKDRNPTNRHRPIVPLETAKRNIIASEENGKQFLRKYCQKGKCNLPKRLSKKITHHQRNPSKKRQGQQGHHHSNHKHLHKHHHGTSHKPRHEHHHKSSSKRSNIQMDAQVLQQDHKGRSNNAKEGIDAVEKAIHLAQDKYADRRRPREDRPIVPLEENDSSRRPEAQSYDKEFVIIKPIKAYPPIGKIDDTHHYPSDRQPFEVNQINLHVDVNVKQAQQQQEKQGQQEKQAILEGGKDPDHETDPSNHHNKRHAAQVERQNPPPPHRHEKPRRYPTSNTKPYAYNDRPRHSAARKAPNHKEGHHHGNRGNCSLTDMRRYMRTRLDKWRRAFESESMWAKVGMVMALGAIITMQVYVISKFIRMLFGRAVYEDLDDCDDDDEDGSSKQERGMSNYKSKSRRGNRRRHSYDARAPMLDKH